MTEKQKRQSSAVVNRFVYGSAARGGGPPGIPSCNDGFSSPMTYKGVYGCFCVAPHNPSLDAIGIGGTVIKGDCPEPKPTPKPKGVQTILTSTGKRNASGNSPMAKKFRQSQAVLNRFVYGK